MWDVMDDQSTKLTPLMFHIQMHKQCDLMLLWLKQNKVTGKRLLDIYEGDWDRSFLKALSFLNHRVTEEKRGVYESDLNG